jgi:hypothetical protein
MGFTRAIAIAWLPFIFRRIALWRSNHLLIPHALWNVLRVLGAHVVHESRGCEKENNQPALSVISVLHLCSSDEFQLISC